MNSFQRCRCYAFVIGLGLAAANGAYAQVGSINSAVYNPREFSDVPGATLTTVSNYPALISFNEVNVSTTNGFANRDVWRFSNNGGASAYQFQNNDYFHVSMTLTLTGSPTSPRKEAGFLFDTLGGQGEFIVDTDAHEIVAFGGPFPFYAFPSTFNSGDTITLGMTYENVGGINLIIYSANGVNSPALPFTNLEQGIINNTTLGGYFQIVNDPSNPSNSGLAVFGNISIVPEPSVFALLSLGILPMGLLLRRRHI
jgi:hypothetical protein